jgi:hypothetical protein
VCPFIVVNGVDFWEKISDIEAWIPTSIDHNITSMSAEQVAMEAEDKD